MSTNVEPRRWTIDDLERVKGVSDARFSPDGRHIAFTLRESFKENTAEPRASVWVVDTEGGEPRRFTAGPRADHSPRWSPDSRTLAFLSDREEDGRFGVYTASLAGGEGQKLVDVQGNVLDVQWSPDGSQVAFLMADPETEEEKRRKEEKDDAIEFERDPTYQRVWVAGAHGSNPRAVSTGNVQVWELAWFPDGRRLALVASADPYEWSWYQAYIATLPVDGGELNTIYSEPQQVARPLPSPDGSRVAFVGGIWSDRGVVGGDVFVLPAEGGDAVALTLGYPASFGTMEWLDEETLLAVGYEQGEAAVFRLGVGAEPARLWRGRAMFADRWWPRFSLTANRSTLAVIREDPASPPDVWTANLSDGGLSGWTRRTHLQPDLAELPTGDPEELHWSSPDGREIQGILLRPVGYEEGRSYQLITVVHGGPTSLYHHGHVTSQFMAALFVSEGFAVLLPNPRGSTGWGREFAEANLGDMGGRDLEDVLAGVDAVVESGVADPDRLGIMGWSYGGFMTAWAVTQTDRFKAAMMGAGISNWRSFHGVSNLPTWDTRYYEADPYEPGGAFDRFSPVLHIDKVRTPTLILHGEQDAYVPVGQAYEFYRALKERNVEVELVVYPREGHGVMEKPHLRHMRTRMVEWFRKHLA